MKRVLLYSPDAVGIGHVRRLLKIAGTLGIRLPDMAQEAVDMALALKGATSSVPVLPHAADCVPTVIGSRR